MHEIENRINLEVGQKTSFKTKEKIIAICKATSYNFMIEKKVNNTLLTIADKKYIAKRKQNHPEINIISQGSKDIYDCCSYLLSPVN